MLTLRAPEYIKISDTSGAQKILNSKVPGWQFADDAVIISNNSQNTQPLVNLFLAWTNWADMKIRLDKCQTFRMAKRKNCFTQIIPSVFIGRDCHSRHPDRRFLHIFRQNIQFHYEKRGSQRSLVNEIKIFVKRDEQFRNLSPNETQNFERIHHFTNFIRAQNI